MLRRLTVKNFALLSFLELEFGDRLNILSGETGAGKSIVVDCIMQLMGGRYDKSMLRYGETSGFIEGVFSADDALRSAASDYLEEGDDELIVTRRFGADGKNEIRINGKTATLSMLRTLSASLIEICGQNEHQSLANVSNHIKIVDYYAGHSTMQLKEKVASEYGKYCETVRKLGEIGDAKSRARDLDIYKFQLDEIDRAKVKEGEEEELAVARKRILGAEKIGNALGEALELLSDGDRSVVELVSDVERGLNGISSYGDKYAEWAERLRSVSIEIEDIAESVSDELDALEFSPKELDAIEKRLDEIRGIARKYGDFHAVAAYRDELLRKIDEIENAEDHYRKLLSEKDEILSVLYADSVLLSDERRKAALELQRLVETELSELGMENAVFKVEFAPLPDKGDCESRLGKNGMDEAEFYLSANAGQPLLPLVKIISGGELSRLMLALKVVSSKADDVPSMIFDEIDTGISGKVGREVAKKLARLSRGKQLVCVTHLPQIASMADKHFFIDKYAENGQTYTRVRPLDRAGSIEEISRLSGGKDISTQAEANAEQMKQWSDDYKASLS